MHSDAGNTASKARLNLTGCSDKNGYFSIEVILNHSQYLSNVMLGSDECRLKLLRGGRDLTLIRAQHYSNPHKPS